MINWAVEATGRAGHERGADVRYCAALGHLLDTAVSIQDSLLGATIYVTIDGSTPSLSSPLYRGPLVITQTAKVQAIVLANGYCTSPVAVANYTPP